MTRPRRPGLRPWRLPRTACPACGQDVAYRPRLKTFVHHGQPYCIGSGMDIEAKAEVA